MSDFRPIEYRDAELLSLATSTLLQSLNEQPKLLSDILKIVSSLSAPVNKLLVSTAYTKNVDNMYLAIKECGSLSGDINRELDRLFTKIGFEYHDKLITILAASSFFYTDDASPTVQPTLQYKKRHWLIILRMMEIPTLEHVNKK